MIAVIPTIAGTATQVRFHDVETEYIVDRLLMDNHIVIVSDNWCGANALRSRVYAGLKKRGFFLRSKTHQIRVIELWKGDRVNGT